MIFTAISLLVGLVTIYLIFVIFSPLIKILSIKKQLNNKTQILFYPIYGLQHYMKKKSYDVFEVFYDFFKKKPDTNAVLTNIFNTPVTQFTSPAYIKLFTNNENNMERVIIVPTAREKIVRNSLFLTPYWKRQRKMLGPYFHHDRLKNFVNTIEQVCDELILNLDSTLKNSGQKDVALNTVEFSAAVAGETIIKFFFSEDFKGVMVNGKPITVEVTDLLSDLFQEGRKPFNQIKGRFFGIDRFLTAKEKEVIARINNIEKIAIEMINKRRKSVTKNNQDLLSAYVETLESQEGKEVSPEEKVTEIEIVQQFLTLFFAGTDTTSHVMAMSIYSFAKYPECGQKLEKEISDFYATTNGELNYETISGMFYLGAFVKEVLRMYTPVNGPFLRKAQNDFLLGDLKVKKGDVMSSSLISTMHNQKYFPNPELFDPERWLGGRDSLIDPFAYMPFYAGQRNCIGQHLAPLEIKVLLIKFIKNFRVKLNPEVQLKIIWRFLRAPLRDDLVRVEKK